MVNPDIWKTIPNEDVKSAKSLDSLVKKEHGDSDTEIGHENPLGVLGLIQGRVGVEMVHFSSKAVLLSNTTALGLTFMEVVTSDVAD